MINVDIRQILKSYWGYDHFRPLQEEIIKTILSGKDCLALLPTGGGKSICFQVPSLAMEGICLVISPLIALMKDQVENLRKRGITAFSIHAGLSRNDVRQVLNVAGNSNCKFLYVSPERLHTNLFKEFLASLNIRLIAVDEAHCISQWGYDFRPSYLRIAELRSELPEVPLLALTASATPIVQEDICSRLLFPKKLVFRQPFDRPNLSYSAFNVHSRINRASEILKKVDGTAIIYCRSRKRTREISDLLKIEGIKCDYYHAGLTAVERNTRQENWLQNKTRVIVCTNAFGMGIDKPDVRLVIHADVPDCLENYYQEAGRAGRDGRKSYAVLLYGERELRELRTAVEKKFPGIEVIRNVYKALMNHLQVPSGFGEGKSFDLDLSTFSKLFKLDMQEVLASFRLLEQEELLCFNEQVFSPSRAQVTADRARLRELEPSDPELDEVIKTLLRTYEGILDQHTSISERYIGVLLKTEEDEIKHRIEKLAQLGIIKYDAKKDRPQVFLLKDRVNAEDLRVDESLYSARKELHIKRADQMIKFVQLSDQCRSSFIGKYFGDDNSKDCGVCDNCLAKRRKPLGSAEFEAIEKSIIKLIRDRPAQMHEIVSGLTGYGREKAQKVIGFMQSERKINVDERGLISLAM